MSGDRADDDRKSGEVQLTRREAKQSAAAPPSEESDSAGAKDNGTRKTTESKSTLSVAGANGSGKVGNGHSRAPLPDASPMSARAEVSRLRRSTGIADVLPPRPEVLTRQIPSVELPAHAVRDSMLHQGSGFDNYRGLYNLALLGLVCFQREGGRERGAVLG